MNVLLTCAGRRNYLVRAFCDALDGSGKVLAGDQNPEAPALQDADVGFTLHPVQHPMYVNQLADLCEANEVGLLVPLNDLELPVLARNRERLEVLGVAVVVSSPEVVGICGDKWLTIRTLREHGIATPKSFLSTEDVLDAIAKEGLSFPLIVKPRWGSASLGIEVVADARELATSVGRASRYSVAWSAADSPTASAGGVVIQEMLAGEEYGLDVVNDLSGGYVATFARKKLVMRAGETDQAITLQDSRFDRLGRSLGEILGHVGDLDCDIFDDGERITVIDMNPRFGGGYPFSHAAGLDLPATLIAWASGAEPDTAWLTQRPGVVASKYDQVKVIAAGAADLAIDLDRDEAAQLATQPIPPSSLPGTEGGEVA